MKREATQIGPGPHVPYPSCVPWLVPHSPGLNFQLESLGQTMVRQGIAPAPALAANGNKWGPVLCLSGMCLPLNAQFFSSGMA